MARMSREEKQRFVEELAEKVAKARAVVMSTYSGLTVEEINELRNTIKQLGAEVRVIKNTLMKRAFDKAGLAEVNAFLKGPIIYYFDYADEVQTVKAVAEISKKYEEVQFISGVIDGNIYDAEQMQTLAKIPSRQELMGKLVGSVYSPIYGFYYALQYNLTALVRALDEIRKSKEVAEK